MYSRVVIAAEVAIGAERDEGAVVEVGAAVGIVVAEIAGVEAAAENAEETEAGVEVEISTNPIMKAEETVTQCATMKMTLEVIQGIVLAVVKGLGKIDARETVLKIGVLVVMDHGLGHPGNAVETALGTVAEGVTESEAEIGRTAVVIIDEEGVKKIEVKVCLERSFHLRREVIKSRCPFSEFPDLFRFYIFSLPFRHILPFPQISRTDRYNMDTKVKLTKLIFWSFFKTIGISF